MHPAASDREVVDRCHHVASQIVAGCSAIRTAWVHLGGFLFEFTENRMWEPLGHESLEEWLASPEVELSRTHVFRLARVYRALVVEREVPPEALAGVDITKADIVLPSLRAGDVSEEQALADVRSLTRKDLLERYGGDVNGKLAAEGEPVRERCPTCGQWKKVA